MQSIYCTVCSSVWCVVVAFFSRYSWNDVTSSARLFFFARTTFKQFFDFLVYIYYYMLVLLFLLLRQTFRLDEYFFVIFTLKLKRHNKEIQLETEDICDKNNDDNGTKPPTSHWSNRPTQKQQPTKETNKQTINHIWQKTAVL